MSKNPSGIYASTNRTGLDPETIKQLSKARTDSLVLNQTPYIMGQQLPSGNSGGVSTTNNNSNDVAISGAESQDRSEEYVAFDHNKFCCPL